MVWATARWGPTFKYTLMLLLWKQISTPHTTKQTHHCYADNKKGSSDWRGSCTSCEWLSMGRKVKDKAQRTSCPTLTARRAVSIYITPCTTCGELMGAKNRRFRENLIFSCVRSVSLGGGGGYTVCMSKKCEWLRCTQTHLHRAGLLWFSPWLDHHPWGWREHKKWCYCDPHWPADEVMVFWASGTSEIRNKLDQALLSF